MTFDSIGFRGLIREGLLPLEMAWRGKSPAIRRRPLKSVREIQTLLDVVEESE